MARTTIVRHPDGTVSKRTSKSRVYSHAVVIEKTAEARAVEQEHAAAIDDAHVARYETAATGAITEDRRPAWAGGESVSLYVGGVYAGYYNTAREERPSDEVLRKVVEDYAANARKRAATYRARAAQERAGTTSFSVLRWSSREDLARKAAEGEFARMVREGVKVYVVECQEKD